VLVAVPPCRPRSLQGFCGVLRNGSDHFPRVAAMLPIRGADVEQRLQCFMDLLPVATAGAVLSSWLFASMLGLRGPAHRFVLFPTLLLIKAA